jgi:hypothetical protein
MYLNVFDDINYIDLCTIGAAIVLLAQKINYLMKLKYKIHTENILIILRNMT